MGSIPEEIEIKDGSQLVMDDSVTVSVESSFRTGSGSRSSSDCSSSAQNLDSGNHDSKLRKQGSKVSEIEMMKERFAKLLLGEDMSGSGKGVCSALAISSAITNLWATVFGQLWRLEPLPPEKKTMWRREMDCLLCASNYIVELKPSWQTFPDGKRLEVMTSLPRSDLFINLPALRKLDAMLLEILDGFTNTEFWYVDHGVTTQDNAGSASSHKGSQRQEEKWWLPVPRVPPGGLCESTRKQLNQMRECASQILKAVMSINSIALDEMEVPESYVQSLPKNGKACLGDVIYRYFTSVHFSPESLLDCLDPSSEHIALEIANRVEAAANVWRRRQHPKKLTPLSNRSAAKSSWLVVRDLMTDGGDKRDFLAERADGFLRCLKLRFPALTQTTLDASKIQCNKDVGKAILESYSRVLESLAFNIVARIEDLLYVDTSRHSKELSSLSSISHKKVTQPLMVPITPGTTPNRIISFSTPVFSPAQWISPPSGERIPFLNGNVFNKPPSNRGIGVRRVLMNYLSRDSKLRNCGNILDTLGSVSGRIAEGAVSRLSMEVKEVYRP